jgi:hypothetical protein
VKRRRDESHAAAGAAAEALDDLRRRAADLAHGLRESASAASEQMSSMVMKAGRVINETVQQEAGRLYDEQKDRAARKVANFGKVFHQVAHALHAVRLDGAADYVDSAANRVGDASDYLRESDLKDLIEDAQDVIRDHPGLAMGGLFVAGLAVARFVKAGLSDADGAGASARENGGSSRRSIARRGTDIRRASRSKRR